MTSRARAALAWGVWIAAIGLAVAGVVLFLGNRGVLIVVDGEIRKAQPAPFPVLVVLVPGYATIGAMIVARRANRVGWIMLAIGGLAGLLAFTTEYSIRAVAIAPGTLPAGGLAAAIAQESPLLIPLVGLLMLLFPDGHVPTRRWRAVAWVVGVTSVLVAIATLAAPTVYVADIEIDNPLAPFGSRDLPVPWVVLMAVALFGVLAVVAATFSPFVRHRRASREQRLQLKWLAYVALITGVGLLAVPLGFLGFIHPVVPVATMMLVVLGGAVGIPAAIGIAILRHRLFDIDVVISRTVKYGVLAVVIGGVYVLIAIAPLLVLGRGGESPIALSLIATGVVAFAFAPFANWAQRLANRVVYGRVITPYEAMVGFAHQMADAVSVDEVLPRTARAAAEGIAAARARVTVHLPDGSQQQATWPLDATGAYDHSLPVHHRGEAIGEIEVDKPAGEELTPAESTLLDDLARQAGPALRNVALTAELERRLRRISIQTRSLRESRSRIVAAQDAERRRMERDIHDGAQQNLVAMQVKLGLATTLLDRDHPRALAMIDDLSSDAQGALEQLRDLARGIYPPILIDRGIAAALRSLAARHPSLIQIDDEGTDRYPSEVEAAIYFCCLEAIQNAAKHATGATVTVSLAETADVFVFTVRDDGPGFDPAVVTRGSGTQNMTDRIEALGGSLSISSAPGAGTTVRGEVPARALVAA